MEPTLRQLLMVIMDDRVNIKVYSDADGVRNAVYGSSTSLLKWLKGEILDMSIVGIEASANCFMEMEVRV